MPTTLATTRLAALRTLAVAGASDKLLAQAVRELLVDLDAVSPGWEAGTAAADNARQSAAALPAPVASQIAPEPPLTPNVESRSPDPVPAQPEPRTAPPLARRPLVGAPVRIAVREANGNRSSVAIKAPDWAELVALNPDEALLQRKVKELAPLAPEGCNRSGWVCERLREMLVGQVQD